MPITTEIGPTPWSVKEIAAACEVVRTAAPRKLQQFEERLSTMIQAIRALEACDNRQRPCDLAASLVATLAVGGQLVDLDRPRLLEHVKDIIEHLDRVEGLRP